MLTTDSVTSTCCPPKAPKLKPMEVPILKAEYALPKSKNEIRVS